MILVVCRTYFVNSKNRKIPLCTNLQKPDNSISSQQPLSKNQILMQDALSSFFGVIGLIIDNKSQNYSGFFICRGA
jgi:hypothetical protein